MYTHKGMWLGVGIGLLVPTVARYFVAGNYSMVGVSILFLLLVCILYYKTSTREGRVRTVGSMYIMLAHKATEFIGKKEHMDEFAQFMEKEGMTLTKVNVDEM